MARKTVELNLFGEPFEERPRADAPVLQLDDWGNRTIRRLMIKGEPWWVGVDACRILEYANARQAIGRLDDDEKGVYSIDTLGGTQEMLCVNRFGLYALILGSRKPEAKQFKRWITHEVLPAIEKTGRYSTRGGRIARTIRQVGTDDPATVASRIEEREVNVRVNRWLAEMGFKPNDFVRFHESAHVLVHGRRPRDIKAELGLKRYQSVLDRMGPVVLSMHSTIKNLAIRFIQDAAEDRGSMPPLGDQQAMLARAAESILPGFLQRVGFEYEFATKDDEKRGPILDLVRRSIESSN